SRRSAFAAHLAFVLRRSANETHRRHPAHCERPSGGRGVARGQASRRKSKRRIHPRRVQRPQTRGAHHRRVQNMAGRRRAHRAQAHNGRRGLRSVWAHDAQDSGFYVPPRRSFPRRRKTCPIPRPTVALTALRPIRARHRLFENRRHCDDCCRAGVSWEKI
ncbi:uncharacterized protein METZ01_LOCUS267448, partial [marine metagenome]